jgi:hypothetical protein
MSQICIVSVKFLKDVRDFDRNAEFVFSIYVFRENLNLPRLLFTAFMRNLTLTIHFCDISQSFVSATKYENTSTTHKENNLQNCLFF